MGYRYSAVQNNDDCRCVIIMMSAIRNYIIYIIIEQ